MKSDDCITESLKNLIIVKEKHSLNRKFMSFIIFLYYLGINLSRWKIQLRENNDDTRKTIANS